MGHEMGGQLLIVKEAIISYINVLFQHSTAQTDKNHEETLSTRNKNKIWSFRNMKYGCAPLASRCLVILLQTLL